MNSASHLSDDERHQLFAVLDKHPDVFRDEPGLCKIVQHKIPVSPDFKPKRLKGYRIPEKLKPNVEQQTNDMLQQNIIRRSTSPMASPILCILKGPGGRDGVRIVCDFRHLNRYAISDEYPIVDIQDLIQRIGKSRFLSTVEDTDWWRPPGPSQCRYTHSWQHIVTDRPIRTTPNQHDLHTRVCLCGSSTLSIHTIHLSTQMTS